MNDNMLDKVINGLKVHLKPNSRCAGCPYPNNGLCGDQLYRDALALLEALVPRVLQFGELLEYTGAVWPELTFGDGHHEVMPPCMSENDVMSDGTTGLRSTSSILRMEYNAYGKTWRCWTQKPTDEQMEATPWERLN